MKVLGIETSCDECAAAVVEDGRAVLSNIVATQIPFHAKWNGVVPEIASRMHTEWITGVVKQALQAAGCAVKDIDGVAATARPGLLGSLLVGLSFAKSFAWARRVPFVAVDHMLAHLYAPRLIHAEYDGRKSVDSGSKTVQGDSDTVDGDRKTALPDYPFLGLLVSGGHTIICRVDGFDSITVLGTTIDDAMGEAFDKTAKFYSLGYPGGAVIDRLAEEGDSGAFHFPLPNLYKGEHRYDVSYSGLKTAVINQIEQFRAKPRGADEMADLAASFRKTAVEILLRALFRAVEDTGLSTVVAGGGAAANALLRARLAARRDIACFFPPLEFCGDNGAMVAGIGFQYLRRGETSPLTVTASARVTGFKKKYP